MKKILLIGLTIGISHLMQADTITLDSNDNNFSGDNAYQYLLNISIPAGEEFTSASLNFANVTLTVNDAKNTVNASLINGDHASHVYGDNDQSGNYFSQKYGAQAVSLGEEDFNSPTYVKGYYTGSGRKRVYHPGYYIYDTESWSDIFTPNELADLDADNGVFDIGIDPDCRYTVGSITFTYTLGPTPHVSVPDSAMTGGLLALSFSGLLLLRRKFCFN
jgi:hypothetical protein